LDLRCTPDNVEVGLSLVANGVSWAADVDLRLAGPTLVCCAAGRRTKLAWARGVLGVAGNALIATHDREIVCGSVDAVKSAVAELEECLRWPLSCCALVGGRGHAHANAVEWRGDRAVLTWFNGDWRGDLVHVEARVNLEDAEGLGGGAVVVHGNGEVVTASAGRWHRSGDRCRIAVLVSVVCCTIEWDGRCRKGEAHNERGCGRSHLVGLLLVIVDKGGAGRFVQIAERNEAENA
jgi:hypothetical protein